MCRGATFVAGRDVTLGDDGDPVVVRSDPDGLVRGPQRPSGREHAVRQQEGRPDEPDDHECHREPLDDGPDAEDPGDDEHGIGHRAHEHRRDDDPQTRGHGQAEQVGVLHADRDDQREPGTEA